MIYISALGLINALGNTTAQVSQRLSELSAVPHNMLQRDQWLLHQQPVWVGEVADELPAIPSRLAQHDSRNNQLLLAAFKQIAPQVQQAIAQYGNDRIAIIMGTSTSGIDEGDLAVKQYLNDQSLPENYHYHQQELGDPAIFLAKLLATTGPAYTLSTACSSSARAIMSGQRLIAAGLVDVALVGGADSLCRMPINGFHALESISSQPCTPFAEGRQGINIGEAAALFLLTKEPQKIALLGSGESSDAHHMSAPHPEGEGATRAMQMALDQANLTAQDIGYINLHGTATPLNDSAESKAVHRLFANHVPCSSTKHLTGHTLGAAGATELGLSYLMIQDNLPLPQQDFSVSCYDSKLLDINIVIHPMKLKKKVILSNSFAFGGNNASLIIGEVK